MANSNLIKAWKPWQLHLRERRVLLIIGDLLMAALSLILSLWWWDYSVRFIDINFTFLQQQGFLWFYLLPIFWILLLFAQYDVQKASNWKVTFRSIISSAIVGLLLYSIIYFYYVDSLDTLLPRLSVGIFLVLCVIFTLVWRLIYIRIFTSHTFMRRIFIVGGGRSGQALLQVIKSIHPPPFVVVGIIDDDPDKQGSTIEDLPVMGTCERLLGLINQHNITDLFVAISGKMFDKTFQTLLEAQEKGVIITRMPVAYEELVGRVPIQLLEADWIMSYFVDKAKVSGFNDVFKRLLDIIGGLIGSIIFLLFLPIIGLAILIDDGWPIFYFQTRTGRGGRLYRITKFRTMRRDAEADGTPKWAKEDDERATRTGRILRKTHLDELPQFINVLTGDMSLVGPRAERPELVDFFQKQVPFYRTRLLVRPGMTGWAQVNFGYAATIEETTIKLEYDIYYILHRNILMDLVIILRTPSTVFGFRGR